MEKVKKKKKRIKKNGVKDNSFKFFPSMKYFSFELRSLKKLLVRNFNISTAIRRQRVNGSFKFKILTLTRYKKVNIKQRSELDDRSCMFGHFLLHDSTEEGTGTKVFQHCMKKKKKKKKTLNKKHTMSEKLYDIYK